MRRFLPAAGLAVLMALTASRADAGYLIIRVLLEGTGTGANDMAKGGGGLKTPGDFGGLRPGNGDGAGEATAGGSSVLNPAEGSKHDPTRSVVVVVPIEHDYLLPAQFYTHINQHPTSNPFWRPKLHLNYRGEKLTTNLFVDSTTIQFYETLKEQPGYTKTHEIDIRNKHAAWAKSKADLREGYRILVAALEKGMVNEAQAVADELLAASKDKQGVPPEVAGFATAYAGMQKGVKDAAPKRGAGEFWQAKFDGSVLTPGRHYTLLSWDATEAEVQRRLALLEENFKGFFLWHASRGIALPVPETPLVAVLAKQRSEFYRVRAALDGPARLASDGFYSPAHDVLVLSPDPLDSVGLTFAAQMQQMYKDGVNRTDLLAGKGPKIDANGQNGHKKPADVARMQTLALVERLADDAAATCAISREGSRQLLYATGLAPRHVVLPEWLATGSVNFFTRPKDPAFVTDAEGKWSAHVATSTGFGGPNYVLHRQFKDIYGSLMEEKRDKKEAKEQRDARLALLKNTITDAYFLGLRDPKDVNDPDPAKADKAGIALTSAVTTAQPPAGGVGGMGGGYGGMQQRPPGGGSGRPPAGGVGPRPPMGEGTIGTGMGPGGGIFGGMLTGTTHHEDDPAVLMRKKRARLAVKAQASAWALYYYLAKDRPQELRLFIDELAALPRDLPLNAATMTATFCRAFGLDGSNESLSRFADAWMASLGIVPAAGIDIPLVNPKPPTAGGSGGTTSPLGPGGGGVGPGGGGGGPKD